MKEEESKIIRDIEKCRPKSPTYSDNPYSEHSDGFDSFERQVTQRIKRMKNVKCESYPIGEEPDYIKYGELKGSKFVKEKKAVHSNSYAAAKNK
ncbi:hypothetical protein PCIT_a3089 [Pseudoalteromonas citrea]|uniref:Uncharacterized protein n=2 Tax=Pseudoalteromonas citrea TaxID=43655 RepID=A0AAD4FRS1_9GAMM|nr:hypothetical protein [Pseudoalteromonas citrea]KAF7770125.1 hypothetical protein PCIT_a3089 [Pseudoalteromonas citrea]